MKSSQSVCISNGLAYWPEEPISQSLMPSVGLRFYFLTVNMHSASGGSNCTLLRRFAIHGMFRYVINLASIFELNQYQFTFNNNRCFGEVQFFFQYQPDSRKPDKVHTLAMTSLYSRPHAKLLEMLEETLYACCYTGQLCLLVLPIKEIESVVGAPPLPLTEAEKLLPADKQLQDYVYIVEKPFLDAMAWADNNNSET